MSDRSNVLRETIEKDEAGIVQRWLDKQLAAASFRSDRISKTELSEHSRRFLNLLRQALGSGTSDIQSPAWANVCGCRKWMAPPGPSTITMRWMPP